MSASRSRVLIVEDNAELAEGLAMVLAAQGHDVDVAHEGLRGVETARSRTPDVVLLDIGLPGMSGYEVAERLRAEPGLEGVILVALTGYDEDTERQRSRAAGFDHHLVKPIAMDAVTELVARCAPSRKEQRPPAG